MIADVFNGVEKMGGGGCMKEKINEESGARLKCVSVSLCPMTLSMSVCDYSDLSPLALCLHRPSGLHHTHTNIHTLLNPVRKSSQGPQGRQKKPPQRHKISLLLPIFLLSDLSLPPYFSPSFLHSLSPKSSSPYS